MSGHGRGGGPMGARAAFGQEKQQNVRSTKLLLRLLWGYLKKFRKGLILSAILLLFILFLLQFFGQGIEVSEQVVSLLLA